MVGLAGVAGVVGLVGLAGLAGLAGCAGCGRLGFDPHDAGPGNGVASSLLYLEQASVQEPLLDVPVLVTLDDAHLDRGVMRPDGTDLRFTVEGQPSPLAHEIEELGGPGGAPLLVWVKVPRIEGPGTTLRVSYGDVDAPASTDVVWGPPYVAVFHLAEASGVPRDATGRYPESAILEAGSPAPYPTPGRIGRGRGFLSAQDNAVQVDAQALPYSPFTVSGWFYEDTLPVGGFHALVTRQHADAGDDVFWLGDYNAGYRGNMTRADGQVTLEHGVPATAGRWVHLALTASAFAAGTATASLFVDGQKVAIQPIGDLPTDPDGNPINVGADVNDADDTPDDDLLDGMLDEVRIESVARSPDWLRLQHLSMIDGLIRYGDVQRAPP